MQRQSQDSVNQETRSIHRHQFVWHILMPIVLGTLLFVLLGVMATAAPADKPAVWANISLIFIVSILMLTGIGSIVLLAIGVFGVDWISKKLPPMSYLLQVYIQYFGRKVGDLSNATTTPVVNLKSKLASFKPIIHRLGRSLRHYTRD